MFGNSIEYIPFTNHKERIKTTAKLIKQGYKVSKIKGNGITVEKRKRYGDINDRGY